MSGVEARKGSIGWYKLAQLVSRKEKEKALGIYKLLSYSLEDKAYALQVEGDLLLALEDEKEAKLKYEQAAFLYRKDNKSFFACAIYEHLFSLDPSNFSFLSGLVEYYFETELPDKLASRLSVLEERYLSKKVSLDQINILALSLLDLSQEKKNSKLLKEFLGLLKDPKLREFFGSVFKVKSEG